MNYNNKPTESKRQRVDYPKSGIRTNLFTKGKYLMTEEYEEYVGYYHIYNTGEIFSEGEWDKEVSKKLLLIDEKKLSTSSDKTMSKVFDQLEYTRGVNVSKFKAPIDYHLIPTPEDYENGFVTRYFLGKVNDINYPIAEISKDQYESIGSEGGIDDILFRGVELNWLLKGPLNDEIDDDGNIKVSGVYDTNRRVISEYRSILPNLNLLLTNPIEFSIHSKYYDVNIS